jgi:hypothetical protein
MGQTRRFRDARRMPGLPPTADISGAGRHFAFGPTTDMARAERRAEIEVRPSFCIAPYPPRKDLISSRKCG